MRVWRICSHSNTTLSGAGGIHASGRWHRIGTPVVYCASSPSLAALEVLVHIDRRHAPDDLRLLVIEIPDDLQIEDVEPVSLPRGWEQIPAPAQLQALGSEWLGSLRSAVLRVPSALLPVERNFLLNPRHPDATRIRVVADQAFAFDRRLLE